MTASFVPTIRNFPLGLLKIKKLLEMVPELKTTQTRFAGFFFEVVKWLKNMRFLMVIPSVDGSWSGTKSELLRFWSYIDEHNIVDNGFQQCFTFLLFVVNYDHSRP